MIRSQQQQSNEESQEAKTRLCNVEIQFNRIDDLDTKVAAIQGDLSAVQNQLSIAAQSQHQLRSTYSLCSTTRHLNLRFSVAMVSRQWKVSIPYQRRCWIFGHNSPKCHG